MKTSVFDNLLLLIMMAISCSQTSIYAQELSEICPSNSSIYNDPNEGFSDWIEIYNPTSTAINLGGYALIDNADSNNKWIFSDTVIPAQGYLVFPANRQSTNEHTINFNFPKAGGSLSLLSDQNTTLDVLSYPTLKPDHSFGNKHFFYSEPTPNLANNLSTGYKGYAEKPMISMSKNGADRSIALSTNQNDASIFYSLNGTNPLLNLEYDKPITSQVNTSLMALAVCDSFLPSYTKYYSLFPNPPNNLPIVNLTVDSLALFDSISGIYMPGPNASSSLPFIGANFWKDTAIAAHFAYFNNKGQIREERECELEIHGGFGSRTKTMKPLELIIRNYHTNKTFDYPYFEGKPYHSQKRLIIRNSGNDFEATMMRDGLLHDYVQKNNLNIDVLGYHPAVVYINGHYWGIHNIREKTGKHYVEANYQINSETVNILENESLTVVDGSGASFFSIINYIKNNNLANEDNYNWVNNRLDINSMVDYFILELFVYNKDWPHNNLKIWNAPEQPKWRYLCYDLDVSLNYFWGFNAPNRHYLKYLLENSTDTNPHVRLLKALLKNKEFKRYFINRYADLLNTIFKAELLTEHIYSLKRHISSDMVQHLYKWDLPEENWHKNIFYLISFFRNRIDIVTEELSVTFNKPTAIDVNLSIYPFNAGEIQLNTLSLDSFPFIGKYYPNNKIDLKAIAKPNHSFKYWVNANTGKRHSESEISIDPLEADNFTAVFSPYSDIFNLFTYPNPAINETTINFSVPEPQNISLRLYDLAGRLQIEIADAAFYETGAYEITLPIQNLTQGTYVLSLKSSAGSSNTKVVKF